jgi:hypothetical protein
VSIRRAQDERIEGTPDGLTAVTEISDVPDTPVIGAVADLSTGSTASVAYTAATTGGTATTFTATSSPGGLTGTGASPITVSGLSSGVAYTFTVTASNSTGSSVASAASSSLTLASIGKYESIESVTLTSATSTISFTSIPATYTHLQIIGIGRTTNTADPATCPNADFLMRFNGDTGSNYAFHLLYGNTSSATGYALASQTYMFAGRLTNSAAIASNFGTSVIDILDYKNTNKNKVVRILTGTDNNGTGSFSGFASLESGLWSNTAAITSITLLPTSSANFTQYSSFALYGIKGS